VRQILMDLKREGNNGYGKPKRDTAYRTMVRLHIWKLKKLRYTSDFVMAVSSDRFYTAIVARTSSESTGSSEAYSPSVPGRYRRVRAFPLLAGSDVYAGWRSSCSTARRIQDETERSSAPAAARTCSSNSGGKRTGTGAGVAHLATHLSPMS